MSLVITILFFNNSRESFTKWPFCIDFSQSSIYSGSVQIAIVKQTFSALSIIDFARVFIISTERKRVENLIILFHGQLTIIESKKRKSREMCLLTIKSQCHLLTMTFQGKQNKHSENKVKDANVFNRSTFISCKVSLIQS